MIHVHRRNLVR